MHLAAPMPPAQIGSRGLMDLRLARKIAALSGIPGDPGSSDDAGGGRVWLVDYGRLSTTEITLGGPIIPDEANPDGGLFLRPRGKTRRFRHRDGEQVNFWPIPNVEVSRYGPDTKAALVLSGTNYVLRPVTDAVGVALGDICRQVDSPGLVVAVGLCLLQEVFAAQPILVRNGVQATQIQRALLQLPRPEPTRINPHGRPLARIELGGSGAPSYQNDPRHLEVIHSTWDSVVAEDQYDQRGYLLEGNEPRLRFKQHFGFEQNDIVSATGRPENREWAVGMLEEISEALLTGSMPGLPLSTIWVEDTMEGTPLPEVVIPRQRQVELIVANVAHQLARLHPDKPIPRGQMLRLPKLDPARWRDEDRLTRRAVVLAHYYAVRAAGWFSGMLELDNRRSREDCAERCQDLVVAADLLLEHDDPLRDQVEAHSWGYIAQYRATFGGPVEDYAAILRALQRLERRVVDGRGGKAILVELLPLVLDNLRTVRRAVSTGVCVTPTEKTLTEDIERWWGTARQLRDELIHDPSERSHLDYGYARFLLDPASDDASLLRGLRLIAEVSASRETSAQREGRWIALRASHLAHLHGLVAALARWTDPTGTQTYAQRAFEVAKALDDHEETWTYVNQRVDGPGRTGYDGGVVQLLATLTRGWLAVLRSGVLAEDQAKESQRGAEHAIERLRAYLRVLRGPQPPPLVGRNGSQLDSFRGRLAEEALAEWDAWEDARPK